MGKLYHFSVGCGDCSLIRTDRTFLVDCHDVAEHAGELPKSKILRGVFVTHQHSDHYSGLAYLRSKGFKIEHLVYSPYERRYGDTSVTLEEWNEFASHRDYFSAQGTTLHAPFRQGSFAGPWWKTNGVQFWVLGPARSTAVSDTRELHDACLVVKADLGKRHCLFTGDASDANLQDVSEIRHNCDDILHASHHGSLNGADLTFIKSAAAQYTVISTKAGVYDNVPHPTALQRYQAHTAKLVYRTDDSGSLTFQF